MSTTAISEAARRVAAIFLAGALVLGLLAGTVAAQETRTEPALVVDLSADGSGELTLLITRNLSTEAERTAFDAIRTNETIREQVHARFAARMDRLANATSAAVDREVSLTDTTIDFATTADGATGVVTFTASFDQLAAVGGDRLVLTEPFASGFAIDRPVVVELPDGYVLAESSPTATRADGTLTWDAGTDLTGFELDVRAGDSVTGTPTSTPGFGHLAGLFATVSAVLLSRREWP
jgi:hypothetical protein